VAEPQKEEVCANWAQGEWLCPGWDKCSARYGDCTSSLCCQDDNFECYRRPMFYYSQCRPKQTCTEWTRKDEAPNNGWLCPGWQQCSSPGEECTLSRCCTGNGDFSCFLNKTAGSNGNHWYAECRLNNLTGHGNGTGNGTAGICGDSSEWLCPISWMLWRDVMWESANDYAARKIEFMGVPPAAMLGVFIWSVALAVVTLACGVWHRQNMRAQIQRMELELESMRLQAYKMNQNGGAEEGASLVEEAAMADAEAARAPIGDTETGDGAAGEGGGHGGVAGESRS
jgi:hypothetical protein